MEVMWLLVAVIVVVVLLVGFMLIAGPMNIMMQPVLQPAPIAASPPNIAQPVIVNRMAQPAQVVPRPSLPPITFPTDQPADNTQTEEDGITAPVGNTDSRYVMRSDYPGLQGDELVLTKPLRRRIRLSENGGFLRSYGGGEWRRIPYITIDEHRVYYDKSGFFRVGTSYMKRLALKYGQHNYVLEIAQK